jgi:hypothetical protein
LEGSLRPIATGISEPLPISSVQADPRTAPHELDESRALRRDQASRSELSRAMNFHQGETSMIAETDNNTVSNSIKNSFSNKKIHSNGLGPTKAKT